MYNAAMSTVEMAKQAALQAVNARFQNLMRPGNLAQTTEVGYAAFDLVKNVLNLPPFERMVFVTSFTLNYHIAAIPAEAPSPFKERREALQIKLLDTINAIKMGVDISGTIVDSPASAAATLVEQLFLFREMHARTTAAQERRVQDTASILPQAIRTNLDAYGNQMIRTFLPNAQI